MAINYLKKAKKTRKTQKKRKKQKRVKTRKYASKNVTKRAQISKY